MPPQPVIPAWIRLLVRVAHENSTMLLPFNFKYLGSATTDVTSAQLDALCAHFDANLRTLIQAVMASSYTILSVEATDRSRAGGAFGQYVLPGGSNGALTSDALPANDADVISWRTGLSGRSNRGRTYVFGGVDTSATGSNWASAYTLAVTALATAILGYTGPTSTPVDFAIASIKDLALKLVTGYVIDSVVDSQRRRLPGRGF